jgi:hypothetical protein
MGWLSGILSGYADRQDAQQRDLLAQQREADIYTHLLDHPDPEVRTMAATGMFQLGQPRSRKGGMAGWMGEMQNSPVYDTLAKYMTTAHPTETVTPGLPSTHSPQGYLPLPPGVSPSGQVPSALAQTENSPTQGDPMAAPQPLPADQTPAPDTTPAVAPPPAPPPFVVDRRANMVPRMPGLGTPPPGPPSVPQGAQPAAPAAVAPPTTPTPLPASTPAALGAPPTPPPATAAPSGPGSYYSSYDPGPAVGRTDVTMAVPRFPSSADVAAQTERAKMQAEVQQLQDFFREQGVPDWKKRGLDTYLAEHAKSSLPYAPVNIEYTDANGQTVQELGFVNKQTAALTKADGISPFPAGAHVKSSSGSGRALNKREEIAQMLFDPSGKEEPRALMARLSDWQHRAVFAEENAQLAEQRLNTAKSMADAPLTRQARVELTGHLADQARNAIKPQIEMRAQVENMNAALNRFTEDPNGASQAVITTFEKILNPNSIVRQAAYERSPEYLSIVDRIKGMGERYFGQWNDQTNSFSRGGGAGVPLDALKALAETARGFLVAQLHDQDGEMRRIALRGQSNGIDPREIFGNTLENIPVIGAPPNTTPAQPVPGGGGAATTTTAPKGGPGPEWEMRAGVLYHNGVPY